MLSTAKTMTSFSREGESLSLRLSSLRKHYSHEKHVWDIGCDHGLLGLSFVQEEAVTEINLVDPSELVVNELKKKLLDSYITNSNNIKIHHKKGQELNISSNENCIFIAGMGGKEMGQIIRHLTGQLDKTSRFIISPHKSILELRELLRELPLSLLNEEVIQDEGRFYQVICLVPSKDGEKVSLYGEGVWKGEAGERYRLHTLEYLKNHRDKASQSFAQYLKDLP